ncbi:hypothetical protein CPB86DRAFT_152494 [Serendipita vermifera]|nr:hypothetical protein CPB86DRAFT_152494 [Serendipita vermifera]
MASVTALRVSFYTLHVIGGFLMAIIILTLCLEFRYVRDGSFLASLCLCLSRIISTIVSCLLLFTGVLAGKEPPKALCIAQSALERAQEPLLTSSVLSYAGNLLIALSTVNSPNGLLVQFAKGLIFVFPFLLFAMLSIISLLVGPIGFFCEYAQLTSIRLHHPFRIVSTTLYRHVR